jgi:pSer/pThr/pTyr-binding forkhead associated (FHA) protein
MSVLQIFRGDDFLEEIPLSRAVMGLGRHPQNDIVLDDRSLSRFHARVERRGDRFVVVDCGAQNGVHLNGERVVGESELAAGDRITLGRYVAIFESGAPQRGTPPKNEVRAVPQPGQHDGKNGKNGKNGTQKPKINLDDLDVDLDLPDEPEDRTKKARHKDIVDDEKAKPPGKAAPEKKKADPTLVLLFNGMEVSRHPAKDELIIGRSKQSDVVISLLGLSRKHAKITRAKDGIYVEDLGSQNGTWVNNQRIEGQRKLKHGDLMNFYDYAVLFLEDGNAEVALPGTDFVSPSGETNVDDLADKETGRSPPAPAAAPPAPQPKRPATSRNLADPGEAKPLQSASELVDLGEGSFFDEDFDGSGAQPQASVVEDDPLLDDADLDADLDGGLDDMEAEPAGSGATEIVENLDLGSSINRDLDDIDGGFNDVKGTDGDLEQFEDKTSHALSAEGKGAAWASDAELLKALSNAPDTVMVTLEVTLSGKPYTAMPLSQTVTRVGTDARCEFSLPKTSGLMPWHMTLLHLGGAVVLYRAGRAGRIVLAQHEVDMATLRDGDLLDLGKVRIKVRIK